MVYRLLKCLLVGGVCVVPQTATAQYKPFGHAQRFRLLSPLAVYTRLADTAQVTPLVYQPDQVVNVKGQISARWWVLSEYIEHREVNRYFLRTALVGTIAQPPEPLTKRRRRQLVRKVERSLL
jgi:hypothetical protein